MPWRAPHMTPDPLDPFDPTLGRRRFLQVGAAGAFLCTIGGEKVSLGKAGDAAKADAAAAKVARPPLARAAAAPAGKAGEPTGQQTHRTPPPQPRGGAARDRDPATT